MNDALTAIGLGMSSSVVMIKVFILILLSSYIDGKPEISLSDERSPSAFSIHSNSNAATDSNNGKDWTNENKTEKGNPHIGREYWRYQDEHLDLNEKHDLLIDDYHNKQNHDDSNSHEHNHKYSSREDHDENSESDETSQENSSSEEDSHSDSESDESSSERDESSSEESSSEEHSYEDSESDEYSHEDWSSEEDSLENFSSEEFGKTKNFWMKFLSHSPVLHSNHYHNHHHHHYDEDQDVGELIQHHLHLMIPTNDLKHLLEYQENHRDLNTEEHNSDEGNDNKVQTHHHSNHHHPRHHHSHNNNHHVNEYHRRHLHGHRNDNVDGILPTKLMRQKYHNNDGAHGHHDDIDYHQNFHKSKHHKHDFHDPIDDLHSHNSHSNKHHGFSRHFGKGHKQKHHWHGHHRHHRPHMNEYLDQAVKKTRGQPHLFGARPADFKWPNFNE